MNMTLSEWANLATILGVIIAVGALLYTAYQVRINTLTNRANFWLELEKMFQVHDSIHLKLRPSGEWSDGITGPNSAQEWAALEDYMGLFEHCEIMMKSKLIDTKTFVDIFSYRLRNIVSNRTIVDTKLKQEKSSWRHFLELLKRMEIDLPA